MKIILLIWNNGTQNAFEDNSANLKSFIKWKKEILGPTCSYKTYEITKEQYDRFLEDIPLDRILEETP